MTHKIESPLLAETAKDYSLIRYPVIGSPKLDGIRCLIVDGKAVSRNFKEIPNRHIAKDLSDGVPNGFDGEILLRSINVAHLESRLKKPTHKDYEAQVEQIELAKVLNANVAQDSDKFHLIPFNFVSSEVMRHENEPDFVYCVFDYCVDPKIPYTQRVKDLRESVGEPIPQFGPSRIVVVPTFIINNEEELNLAEQKCVSEGFEGLMIRDPNGEYYTAGFKRKKIKYAKEGKTKIPDNRSDAEEGILLKIKRFEDSEAEIIGFEELRSNQNEKNEEDAFGHMGRSSKKEGIVLAGTCGAVYVRDVKNGLEFKVGSGFDKLTRQDMWDNQEQYLGKLIKYKYQPSGAKELPRFPIFLGFRHKNDL